MAIILMNVDGEQRISIVKSHKNWKIVIIIRSK